MVERIPALLAAVCLTIYWFWVIVKLIRLARKIGKDPNAMPRERVGQLMRLLWYPCIFVLLVGLWSAALISRERLANSSVAVLVSWLWSPTLSWWIVASIASVI